MKCNKHNEREANGICITCGLPFCEGCLIEFEGKNYCKVHAIATISSAERAKHGKRFSKRRWITSLLLCFFLGVFGVHRFYLGRWATGLLWLFTLGFAGIGWLVDIILITTGELN